MRAPLLDWMRNWGVPYFGRGATEAETAAVIAKCQQIAPGVELPIVPHDLKPGFFRCLFGFPHEVEQYLSAQVADRGIVRALATEITNGILSWVEDDDLYHAFERVLEERPRVKAWAANRQRLQYAVSVTDVGRAMVWAELKRLGEDSLTLEEALQKPV